MAFTRVLDQEWKAESYQRSKLGLCRWCGENVKRFDTRRRTFCSQECVDEYLIRADSGHARKLVYKRDKGICQSCGLDCSRWYSEFKRWLRTLPMGYANELSKSVREWAVRFYMEDHGMDYVPDWKHRRTWYDIDHIQEVCKGHGACGLDNLQLLCLPCHRKKTIALKKSLKKKESV